ncbi:PhoH-like protein PhoH [Paenibacillus larvae subsp. larvae]|uniref:PhoH-like protein n=1 Tax=Paenibacillus larvae subsp. larvae TaxID=147375 RepID=A0A2L1UG92_9BACL|nr:PhoH family protein [Paenibacillus larvae]AQZ45351.1 phosphate starvation-inducible protein PhoH [Paenibacillus larvae subsp. pulvifaciens]AVF27304.1 PhoH-like protein PhoH [Paenibacillus larvae subsp. larvae]AVF31967.1 PhoH-like protein PhoH [Paenibacillus larvae subsp. larvae]MBH0343427.1 phosphate starvation protein PhoH [Paenibacillus larvae]MCY7520600.1 PhoH family protein [Paenibacillus larvae]
MVDHVQTSKISLNNAGEALALFGPQDKFIHLIERETHAHIFTRDAELTISGDTKNVRIAEHLFEVLLELVRNQYMLTERDVHYAVELARQMKADQLLDLFKGEIAYTAKGKPIRIKTIGQKQYVESIKNKDIVFGIGPAGTGKTYLAVVLAVTALKEGRIKRIVLTRPAVEAGESLGFLPGDLQEKVDPYLRPLYDALNDVLGPEQVAKSLERGLIEIAPLAYMRGRTLDDSFIILDEAQNTTPEQMKMFLTRLGFGSKMVITGDITQIDLPRGKTSGLVESERILRDIEEIGFTYFADQDVVRHSLVQKIIVAYQENQERHG